MNICLTMYPQAGTGYDTTAGVAAASEGLTAKQPVMIVPGIVSTGLELWKGRPCIDPANNFRKRIWSVLSTLVSETISVPTSLTASVNNS